MTEEEKTVGAKLTKKWNLFFFILAFFIAFVTWWFDEHPQQPTTAELDPNSALYKGYEDE